MGWCHGQFVERSWCCILSLSRNRAHGRTTLLLSSIDNQHFKFYFERARYRQVPLQIGDYCSIVEAMFCMKQSLKGPKKPGSRQTETINGSLGCNWTYRRDLGCRLERQQLKARPSTEEQGARPGLVQLAPAIQQQRSVLTLPAKNWDGIRVVCTLQVQKPFNRPEVLPAHLVEAL